MEMSSNQSWRISNKKVEVAWINPMPKNYVSFCFIVFFFSSRSVVRNFRRDKLPPFKICSFAQRHVRTGGPCNYFHNHKEFLVGLISKVIESRMVYSKPMSPRDLDRLIVPDAVPKKFWFTVDLRPVSQYTVKYHCPRPIVGQTLAKVSEQRYYAPFDFSHGYWHLPWHKKYWA